MIINERQQDIIKIIEQIDISPSMYKNAVDKYNHLSEYLQKHGIKANIYPQGSFALGTVTKPHSKECNRNYDLDAVYQVDCTRDDIDPIELRKRVEMLLKDSDLYGGKLEINDECLTIIYADIGSIGFSIDVVPAVDESSEKKNKLIEESQYPQLIETSIAIPLVNQQKQYQWATNNPIGYKRWFMNINEPFANSIQFDFKKRLFNNNAELYGTVEEIPDDLVRSSLQRVVQILKFHRDVYYSVIKDGDELKPISAIINTIVAKMADGINPYISVFELLEHVLNELAIYSNQQMLKERLFRQQYSGREVITRRSGKWEIKNPANPEDNLANKWNTDERIPKAFFRWARVAKEQLIESQYYSDSEFRSRIETAFGISTVNKVWGSKYKASSPRPISSTNLAKPWKEL